MPSRQSRSPVQPEKCEPAAGITVKARTLPDVKDVLHVAPQSMPDGLLVTAPLPDPAMLMVSMWVGIASRLKVAVQLRSADIVTLPSMQSASPVQPAKVDPGIAVGVSVTAWPPANAVTQVKPQLMPFGTLVTLPLPVPALLTIRVLVPSVIPRKRPMLLLE